MLEVHIQKKLTHFTLDVQFFVRDEIVVLFGPSGSGKTTVLNSVAGLVHPDSGRIQLHDTVFFATGQKPMPTRKRKVGYLFQDYALFPHMSVKENIGYGMQSNDMSDVQAILDVLGIQHLLTAYPHEISGGEKQRVALARALATKPDVLLLDEPLSALDEATRLRCQDELLELHRMWKIPILLVTHDTAEAAKLGNRILSIDRGVLTPV